MFQPTRPDTPFEVISNNLEDVINVRQMTATRTEPNGQIHVESLTLFSVTLTRNVKSQEIFKLNSLNHIIIKVELYRTQTGLAQCYNCQFTTKRKQADKTLTEFNKQQFNVKFTVEKEINK
jgi:hypothetical protein